MNLQRIPLNNLVASAQPRPLMTTEVDKLAASINEVGLIQPITVARTTVVNNTAEPGFKIVAGHHRVAACRALGWTEIDALVIDDMAHLQTELIEIDENLCRAELTNSQRTKYTKRRKQIWEALHPEDSNLQRVRDLPADPICDEMAAMGIIVSRVGPPVIQNKQVGNLFPPVAKHGHAQEKGFAASTSEATGMTKRSINQQLARAEALGDDTLDKVTNTSLDSGVELDALAKMDASERAVLVERAAAGEKVSARTPAPHASKPMPSRTIPIRLFTAVQQLVRTMGYANPDDLVNDIRAIMDNLTPAEGDTLGSALDDLMKIASLGKQV